MHARLAEAMKYVEEKRAELLGKLEGADPGLIAQRPAEDKWSVAEVLDHLQMVEAGVARLITKRVTRAREGGLGKEQSTESILGSIDFMGDTLDNAPIQSPEQVRPRADADPGQALAALAAARKSLREAANLADGFALGEIKHTHAVLGELDLYQWIVFLGRHEARHTRQIERTLTSFQRPPATNALGSR
jgi:hypothetical protein